MGEIMLHPWMACLVFTQVSQTRLQVTRSSESEAEHTPQAAQCAYWENLDTRHPLRTATLAQWQIKLIVADENNCSKVCLPHALKEARSNL